MAVKAYKSGASFPNRRSFFFAIAVGDKQFRPPCFSEPHISHTMSDATPASPTTHAPASCEPMTIDLTTLTVSDATDSQRNAPMLTPMDPLRRQCAGTLPDDMKARYQWFQTVSGHTYCGFCAAIGLVKPEDLMHIEYPTIGSLACPTIAHARHYEVVKDGIQIRIKDSKTGGAFVRKADATVCLPTQVDYAIHVAKHGNTDASHVFRVMSLTIDETPVRLFDHDRPTYITRPVEWNGYTPNGTTRFVSCRCRRPKRQIHQRTRTFLPRTTRKMSLH
jgi:hypothetical protein